MIGTFWLLHSRYIQAVYRYTGEVDGRHRWDRADGPAGFMIRDDQHPACLRRLPRAAARKRIRLIQKARTARQAQRDRYWRRLGA